MFPGAPRVVIGDSPSGSPELKKAKEADVTAAGQDGQDADANEQPHGQRAAETVNDQVTGQVGCCRDCSGFCSKLACYATCFAVLCRCCSQLLLTGPTLCMLVCAQEEAPDVERLVGTANTDAGAAGPGPGSEQQASNDKAKAKGRNGKTVSASGRRLSGLCLLFVLQQQPGCSTQLLSHCLSQHAAQCILTHGAADSCVCMCVLCRSRGTNQHGLPAFRG